MCVESARIDVPKELQRKDDGVLQNLNTALLVVDASARITSSNPPAEQILGESAAALADEKVQAFLAGAAPKKVIVVPGRLVNIVA